MSSYISCNGDFVFKDFPGDISRVQEEFGIGSYHPCHAEWNEAENRVEYELFDAKIGREWDDPEKRKLIVSINCEMLILHQADLQSLEETVDLDSVEYFHQMLVAMITYMKEHPTQDKFEFVSFM